MKKTDHEVTAKMHYIGWEISYKTLIIFILLSGYIFKSYLFWFVF